MKKVAQPRTYGPGLDEDEPWETDDKQDEAAHPEDPSQLPFWPSADDWSNEVFDYSNWVPNNGRVSRND